MKKYLENLKLAGILLTIIVFAFIVFGGKRSYGLEDYVRYYPNYSAINIETLERMDDQYSEVELAKVESLSVEGYKSEIIHSVSIHGRKASKLPGNSGDYTDYVVRFIDPNGAELRFPISSDYYDSSSVLRDRVSKLSNRNGEPELYIIITETGDFVAYGFVKEDVEKVKNHLIKFINR